MYTKKNTYLIINNSSLKYKLKIHIISTQMHCDTFCNASLLRDVCVGTITIPKIRARSFQFSIFIWSTCTK